MAQNGMKKRTATTAFGESSPDTIRGPSSDDETTIQTGAPKNNKFAPFAVSKSSNVNLRRHLSRDSSSPTPSESINVGGTKPPELP
jgi:hypothetical protein